MISTNYCSATTSFPTSTSCRNYYATNRPQPKHYILRSSRRRRPSTIPTPVLILRTPRSLHPNSTRIWNYLPRSSLLRREKRAIRLHRNGVSYAIHRIPRFHRLSSPHVHSRNRRRHPSILYISYYNHCHPNWN